MKANEPFSSYKLAPLITHSERSTDAIDAKVPLNSWRGIFLDPRDAPWPILLEFKNSSTPQNTRRRSAIGHPLRSVCVEWPTLKQHSSAPDTLISLTR
jgi:hypothetical protein